MWQLFYDMFISSNFLGGAMEYQSTEIIARYLATGCTIAVFILLIVGILKICKIICDL